MPSAPPPGVPMHPDGVLPPEVLTGLGSRPFGVYLHVPFCAARCGYCDFNTFTAVELGGDGRPDFVRAARAEVALARRVLGARTPAVDTVFVGGGTPTLLPVTDLAELVRAVEAAFGLAVGAEVTTEANPESVTRESLAGLRAAGFTRVSFGMQSAQPHVLAVLDRRHTPGRVRDAVAWARAAGFEQVSVDLIYGTPGESLADWTASLAEAVALDVDHVSAYALVVEPGTALARRVARGELPAPDDDDLADKYEAADAALLTAGFEWYEVSNWRRPGGECRHNQGYWRGDDWWGVGPGAHSHVGGVRWWNVRHPARYADRLADGLSPAEAGEQPDRFASWTEQVMLGVRTRGGLGAGVLPDRSRSVVPGLVADGLVDPAGWEAGRVVLTLRGRLLTDTVVRALVG